MDQKLHYDGRVHQVGRPMSFGAEAGNTRLDGGHRSRDPRVRYLPASYGTRRGGISSDLIPESEVHAVVTAISDAVLIVTLNVAIGTGYHLAAFKSLGPAASFAGTGLILACLFVGFCRLHVESARSFSTNGFDRLWNAVLAWTLAFAALVFFMFCLKASGDLSRGAIMLTYILGLPAVGVWRIAAPSIVSSLVHSSRFPTRECIVVGDSNDPMVRSVVDDLEFGGRCSATVVGFNSQCDDSDWSEEHERTTTLVARIARGRLNGGVFVCAGNLDHSRLVDITSALSILPRAIYVVPNVDTVWLLRCMSVAIGSSVAAEIRREPLNFIQRTIKRAMDVVISSLALILLLPLLVLTAVAIKLESKGPVFFRQARSGYRGRSFQIFKFRSMNVLENGVGASKQATRNDARVTRVGKIIRELSIDELPQLLNILFGDMSLVGPRPHPIALDDVYKQTINNYEVRQHVKPGLTGWAQVNGSRGETPTLELMRRRIELDLWYAVNATVLLDCEILVRTFLEVARRRNAY